MEVPDRRTKADWARVVQQLVDLDYPNKDRIVLVMDNLNTHHPTSLYEAFPPEEARRIAERLEIHYTPKHGSWLNIDRRQLVLPVTSTIFAGRYGVIIRYGGTVDYRPTNQAIEAETYGRQDTGNGSGQGWDERAFSAQVAERPIAVAGETGASVAHSAGSLRRGVGG